MNSKMLLSSIALDLKRVSLGLQRSSFAMSEKFLHETIKHLPNITKTDVPEYIQKILRNVVLFEKNEIWKEKKEDFLMYSTLIQNYAHTLS